MILNSNSKLNYIHYTRGVAAFFIVVIHCNLFVSAGFLSYAYSHFLKEWTAVFLLVSGFLFQYLSDRFKYRKFFVSKFLNVLLPYFFVSIPAIFLYVFEVKMTHNWVDLPSLLQHSSFYVLGFFYITGSHLGPLWFIPVLSIIFLCVPLSLFLSGNVKGMQCAAFISLVLILITNRPENDSNVILSFIHFFPVYILGMFFCFYRNVFINVKFYAFYLFFTSLLFSIELFFDLYPSFSILVKSFAFLFFCSFFLKFENSKSKVFFYISVLADSSFAIYFLHGYFVGLLRVILTRVDIVTFHPLIGIFLSLFFSIVLCIIIFFVLKMIKFIPRVNSRYLLGS